MKVHRSLSGNSAVFSDDGRHRYRLTREIPSGNGKSLAFLMLNPSTATHETNDPTIRRCIGFARRDGYSRLVVVNLFSLVSSDPAALLTAVDADGGMENDRAIICAVQDAEFTVCAWGEHGQLRNRAEAVMTFLYPSRDKLRRLSVNRSGHPKHPLYVRADAPLLPLGSAQ